MDEMQLAEAIATLVATAIGATWALRAALSKIEVEVRGVKTALVDHVKSDSERFDALGARVIKLESRRGKRP